jgi:hypothetical protein
MRFILALTSAWAILAAGCNSKPPPTQTTEEPVSTTEFRNSSKSGFRQRSARSDTPTNEVASVRIPIPGTKKRSPFPPAALQPGPGAAQNDESAVEDAPGAIVADNLRPEDIPQEDDEILISPKMLGKLIPGANFDSVERQEPINVKSLLDQQGIVLTNYQQLVEMGITNYQIVRAQRQAEVQSEK